MRNSRILGVGRCVPEQVVTHADMSAYMETSDDWIQQRTGIRERHFIGEDTGASDLGVVAAREALDRAGVKASDLDLIIFATLSPDVDMPASACLLQAKLGVSGMPAFDVRNQCSGFLYSLSIADNFIRSGTFEHVLVVGGEIHSTGIDLTTRGREVAVIFGDGAAAVVLGPSDRPDRGILSTHLHAEGKFAEKLWLEEPGTRKAPRLTDEILDAEDPGFFPHMEGRYVFRHAVTRFPEVIREALEANGLTVPDISLLIPHQANLRISQMVASSLELSEQQVFNNIDRYGNTTAATIPLATRDAVAQGKIKKGDLVLMAAVGAGYTVGASLWRWAY